MLEDLLLYVRIPVLCLLWRQRCHTCVKLKEQTVLHHREAFLLLAFLLWFTSSTATWVQGVLQAFTEGDHTQVHVDPS